MDCPALTKRRKLTPSQKAEIMAEQGGACYACSEPLEDGDDPTEYDHVLALALGGADTVENICAMHRSCHRGHDGKTSRDIRMVRKADRQGKAHRGEKKRKGRALQSRGFDKRFRKRMDGTVVRRDGE
jgi:hypothetical protein